MNNLYTIGFTQKTAEKFFDLLKSNKVELVIDVRLNNTSQLAGFSKYPDINYFINTICEAKYIHETAFSPTEYTLKRYKKNEINWEQYTQEFNDTLKKRNIDELINKKYLKYDNVCLLCSEALPMHCHRSIIAEHFYNIDKNIKIEHL